MAAATLPPFAIRRGQAAASLSISPSLFDAWVRLGIMPEGKRIGGVILWDTEALRTAWQAIADKDEQAAEDEGDNPFDNLVA